jgi:hypothetical protein
MPVEEGEIGGMQLADKFNLFMHFATGRVTDGEINKFSFT